MGHQFCSSVILDINWDGVCWLKLTQSHTSLLQLQISCTLTLDLVRSIKLILQGESAIKRYTYNTQQLLLKFMALQHGHALEFMVDRHIDRCIKQEIRFKDSNQISKWCQFQNEAELLEWVLENRKHVKTHLRIVLDGPQSLKQAEAISGESPLVGVKHSEWRRLTSECGYLPAWENFMNSGACESLFDVLVFTVQ